MTQPTQNNQIWMGLVIVFLFGFMISKNVYQGAPTSQAEILEQQSYNEAVNELNITPNCLDATNPMEKCLSYGAYMSNQHEWCGFGEYFDTAPKRQICEKIGAKYGWL